MALTIQQLTDAITQATQEGGAWGQNMHPSKAVLLRVGNAYFPLTQVATTFYNGSFALVLDGGAPS